MSWDLLGTQAVQGLAAGMAPQALLARAELGDRKAPPGPPGPQAGLVPLVYQVLPGELTVAWVHLALWVAMVWNTGLPTWPRSGVPRAVVVGEGAAGAGVGAVLVAAGAGEGAVAGAAVAGLRGLPLLRPVLKKKAKW